MSHGPDVKPVIDSIKTREFPAIANMLSLAGIGWGVVAFGYGYFVADKAWTMGAFLVALIYVISIAQGGVIFAVIQTGTWARWGRPMKRIGEAFGMFSCSKATNETNYLAQKFARTALGSNNIDSCNRT